MKTKVGHRKSVHQLFTFPLFKILSLNSVLFRVNFVLANSIITL